MSGSYLLYGSILEKCGKSWKNSRFSGRIWSDWGNTAWPDMAGLGSCRVNDKYLNYQSTFIENGVVSMC